MDSLSSSLSSPVTPKHSWMEWRGQNKIKKKKKQPPYMDWGVGCATVAPRLTDSYLSQWRPQWLPESLSSVKRPEQVSREGGEDASISSTSLMPAYRAEEWSHVKKCSELESGCTLFAALCQEDPFYSQTLSQLSLLLSLWTFNPLPPYKKPFLDFGLGRQRALSVGQLPDEVPGSSSALMA